MSSLFESFLGNAAGAGANIIGDRMKADEDERKIKLQDELLMKRQMAIEALREEQTIRGEQRGIANRSTERNQVRNEEIADEPRKRQGLIDTYKAQKKAEYDPELQGMAIEADTKKATAKNQAELDFYTKNRTGIIGQKRDMARAAHIDDGAGLRAVQIEAANMTLAEKKDAQAKLNEYETTKDPKRKMELREALVLRGVIKPSDGEGGTEKVTEKTTDPVTGKEITVERKQRIGAGSGKTEEVRVDGKVIGQAGSKEEAIELVRRYKAGNAGATAEKKAAFPAQSGSHGAEVAKPTANVNAQIQDRMMRLKLQGISEETKIRLMQEIEELKRGGSLLGSLTNR